MVRIDWQLGNRIAARRAARRRGKRIQARRGALAWDVLESRLAPVVSTWSGAVSNLWSDSGNWDVPPVAGNDLVFPAGASNLANTDDLAAGTSFTSLTIAGGGYTIGGSAIALTGTLDSAQASGSNTVDLPITAGGSGPLAVTVDATGASLVLGAPITSSNGVSMSGAGVLDVDSAPPGSPVTLAAGTTLGGTGTVGPITATSATVSPGDQAPGVLNDSGDLNLDSGSAFQVALDGNTAGSGFSQLVVSGQVNLDNATLDPTAGFTPTENESFTIIDNTGTGAVNGQFAGLPPGSTLFISGQPYSISYTGGDGNDVVLTSQVASTTTTTTLSASPTSFSTGQTITLTATVAAASSSSTVTPTGTVEFFNGATSLGSATLAGGVATLSSVSLTATSTLTATYEGDTNYDGSTAPGVTVILVPASTTTLTTAPNPSVVGQAVTLAAAVASSAGVPTGTIMFLDGSVPLGVVDLDGNGSATLTITTLPAGSDSITADYSGDFSLASGTSAAVIQTVTQASTTTTLTVAPLTTNAGQPVTLAVNVAAATSSGTPTGTVTFLNGATTLGTATLDGNGNASLETTALPAGTNTITAQYSGDSNDTASTSAAVAQTVSQVAQPSSITTIALSATTTNPAAFTSIPFTVNVAAGGTATVTPTGTVVFFAQGAVIGSATLDSSGSATFSTADLALGHETITAVYQGDSTFSGSTSAPLSLTVGTGDELFVNQIYLTILDRTAEQAGLEAWTTALQDGLSRQAVVRRIMNSPEAHTLAQETAQSTGRSTPPHYLTPQSSLTYKEQRINGLYEAILGRPADPEGLQFWIGVVNDGFGGRTIKIDLLGSDEYDEDITTALQPQPQS